MRPRGGRPALGGGRGGAAVLVGVAVAVPFGTDDAHPGPAGSGGGPAVAPTGLALASRPGGARAARPEAGPVPGPHPTPTYWQLAMLAGVAATAAGRPTPPPRRAAPARRTATVGTPERRAPRGTFTAQVTMAALSSRLLPGPAPTSPSSRRAGPGHHGGRGGPDRPGTGRPLQHHGRGGPVGGRSGTRGSGPRPPRSVRPSWPLARSVPSRRRPDAGAGPPDHGRGHHPAGPGRGAWWTGSDPAGSTTPLDPPAVPAGADPLLRLPRPPPGPGPARPSPPPSP